MKCNWCNKIIEKGTEIKIFGKSKNYFCSEKCAKEYQKAKKNLKQAERIVNKLL